VSGVALPANPPGGGGWGRSLAGRDDGGRPEGWRAGMVFDSNGRLLDGALGVFAYSQGVFPVVADADDDGVPELLTGNGAWQWDAVARHWVAEAWAPTSLADGHVAIADFGDFAGAMGWPPTTP